MKTFRLLDKSHVRHLKAHLAKLKSKGTIKNEVKKLQNLYATYMLMANNFVNCYNLSFIS